jgi:SAM-dependent methyltransferase
MLTMRHRMTPVGLLAAMLVFVTAAVQAKTREDCQREFSPRRGQAGKDVIWWPTHDGLVARMLRMAKVTADDTVYDLGAGDGRIPITAAKQFGARAVGIESEAPLVRLGQCLAEAAGVADRVQLRQGDIFQTDFSDATVVTLYLLQELNLRLRPALLDMKPGTRILSHDFTMDDWEPDDRIAADFGVAYLWIVPAKVAGHWTFRADGSGDEFTVDLEQRFQYVQGSTGSRKLTRAKLRGPQLEFAFPEHAGLTRVVGLVKADRIEAKVTRNGRTLDYVGSRGPKTASRVLDDPPHRATPTRRSSIPAGWR